MKDIRIHIRSLLADKPLVAVLVFALVIRLVGLGWGLPNSDGWDVDGVAPRDVLAGLVLSFRSYFTYPVVHLVIVSAFSLFAWLPVVWRVDLGNDAAVVAAFIDPAVMTPIAWIARAISVAMSLGIILTIHRLTALIWNARAAIYAAFVATVASGFVYYSHTSNLDVPQTFWTLLAWLAFARAIASDDPTTLWKGAIFAVLAICTKDQAYASFVIAAPTLAVWWAMRSEPQKRSLLGRQTAKAIGLAFALFSVTSLAVVRPAGFAARIRFLLGPASQDFATYSRDKSGTLRLFADVASRWHSFYPLLFALFGLFGLGTLFIPSKMVANGSPRSHVPLLRALPLLAAMSFTLAFNLMARRTDERFVLLQALLCACYIGSGLDALGERVKNRFLRRALPLALAPGLVGAFGADATLLNDPRYKVESWIREHSRPDESVEIYGGNVYQPRIVADRQVSRVGPEPVNNRSPYPKVLERQAPFSEAASRNAAYLIVSEGWVWKYLLAGPLEDGRLVQPGVRRDAASDDGLQFFPRLLANQDPAFEYAFTAEYGDHWLPCLRVHSATCERVHIFARRKKPL